MTEEQLRMLDAVARTGSFRAAAGLLGRSQSAISKAVIAFEEQLGFAVFSREQYRPTLTPRGSAFLERARALIDEIDALKAYGSELVAGVEPVFGVAVHHIAPIDRVLEALGSVSRRFPNTRFDLSIEAGRGAFNRLKERKADLAISQEIVADPEIEMTPLLGISMVVVRAPHFLPEISEDETVSRQTALRLPQVVVREVGGSAEASVPFAMLDGKGHQWMVNDFTTKKQIIRAGLAWGRLPLHHARAELADGSLIHMRVDGIATISDLKIKAQRRRALSYGAVAQAFWQALTEKTEDAQRAG
jgi:DNA-binding transcriptional LysR family regulator